MLVRRRTAPLLNVDSDVGEGPVVVLVHGIASSSATFERVIPMLSDRYRYIALDLLGFGGSPAPDDAEYTVEEHVEALHRTIRSLGLDAPFILVGHSLGSLLSARYAAVHPQQVSRLVLMSPPVYLAPTAIGDPRARSQVSAYLRVYEFMRTNKEFTMAAAATIGRIFGLGKVLEVTERNWRAFTLSLQNCIESQTAISDIAAVRVPIDVVYGAFDQFIAPGTIRIIEQMRHVTMHRVDVGDHVVRPRLARALADVIG